MGWAAKVWGTKAGEGMPGECGRALPWPDDRGSIPFVALSLAETSLLVNWGFLFVESER